ncbi:FUSC family protein [Roseococcus pinisoli]|uniref:FUSC family protein n=1 Tax=Roseococcus pinisoli TaxID=2835040 RepID=A0ABS5QGN4_9PROT|nr:FUSC family protein [Roseococcus pinisoli]MBS7811713.1 FUSC family protein [Roseococcus pinisoli]
MPWGALASWLDRIDPGTHRRIKGLRLVTAFGLAALVGALHDVSGDFSRGAFLTPLAGGLALWASVSEGQLTRWQSARDLTLLVTAAVAGASLMALASPRLALLGTVAPEAALVTGAFLVSYLRRFGRLGTGLGSQIYTGQLLAYGLGLAPADLPMLAVAWLIAVPAAIVPRMLSGPAERPDPAPPRPSTVAEARLGFSPELVMGLQAAISAVAIVALTGTLGLQHSVWAITASTYVVASTASGTRERVRRRVVGTFFGVPLGLACLPIAEHAPVLIWAAAALAMVIYAMSLPARYDIACGAFAFTLIVTLAASGEHSISHLAARLWETALGGAFGVVSASLFLPLRPKPA